MRQHLSPATRTRRVKAQLARFNIETRYPIVTNEGGATIVVPANAREWERAEQVIRGQRWTYTIHEVGDDGIDRRVPRSLCIHAENFPTEQAQRATATTTTTPAADPFARIPQTDDSIF